MADTHHSTNKSDAEMIINCIGYWRTYLDVQARLDDQDRTKLENKSSTHIYIVLI